MVKLELNRSRYNDLLQGNSELQRSMGIVHQRSVLSPKRRICLSLTLMSSLFWPNLLTAQDDSGKSKPAAVTPMPPIRPAHLPAAPAASSKGTMPAAQPVPLADPVATIYTDHGPSLPPASHARMHQCGKEWDNMKASGAAAEQTWRAFAQACLIR